MSANDRTFDDTIAEAKALLEDHADAEYEALEPSAKANYQEALEFLRRLESAGETADGGERFDESRTSKDERSGRDLRQTAEPSEDGVELDCDLESTMGDDGAMVGPFGGHDVVVYDPDNDGGWLSMDYDATVSIEDLR